MAIVEDRSDSRTSFYQHDAETGSYLSPAYNQEVLKEVLKPLRLATIRRICDLGSGIGSNLPSLLELFPSARIIAADLSRNALLTGAQISASVIPAQSDATSIPFAGGTMDLVICTEVLEHVGNLEAAVAEIARILKPSGYAAISSPNYLNPMGFRKWWNDRRLGESFWDPWGGHPGFERLMLPVTVAKAFGNHFTVAKVLGAGYIMAWIPLGYRRIGPLSDRHPMRGAGRIPFVRDCGMNRYLLLQKGNE